MYAWETIVMSQKKILVPFGPSAKDLKSVHYALALAERLKAQVYILQNAPAPGLGNSRSVWAKEALLDLINSARLAGLTVSHLIANGGLEEEIIGLVKEEGIDVIVCGADDGICERCFLQIKPLFTGQIIQVKEKNHVNYL